NVWRQLPCVRQSVVRPDSRQRCPMFGYGKRWWRRASGISNAQRQLSRKLGIPLSGRTSRPSWLALLFPAGGGRQSSAPDRQPPAMPEPPPAPKPAPVPVRLVATSVTADRLLAEYRAGEDEADRRYKGRWIEVEGVTGDTGADFLGKPFVMLRTGKELELFGV